MSTGIQNRGFSKRAFAIAVSALVLYVVLIPANLFLYNVIMFPCPDPRTPNMDAQFEKIRSCNITAKDVAFRSANGRLLRGWFLELPYTKRVFLYSHGKGDNIYGKFHVAVNLLLCGGSVLMYDYQGYGMSEGKTSVDGACDDAVAAYDYLIDHEHRTGTDIIAFGESFGTGVTGQLAERRKLGGIILQSGFTSLMRAGRDTFFWLRLYPDWCFPRQIMDNIAVFSKPHPPLLIVHGKKDHILSFENATDLYSKAIPPKSLLVLPGWTHGVRLAS
jgi:uncharacterized protein